MRLYGTEALEAARAAPKPAPTILPAEHRRFYQFPRFSYRPGVEPRPFMRVINFVVDPSTRTIDFSNVPAFDLSRLRGVGHVRGSKITGLYARPPFVWSLDNLLEIDGVAVPRFPPLTGKILKVKCSMEGMLATDEFYADYDLPADYVPADPFDPIWQEYEAAQ